MNRPLRSLAYAAAMLLATSCTQEITVPDPGRGADEEPGTRGVQNQIYNSLGVGYDITKGYLNDDATTYPVVDIASYIASGFPDAFATNPTTSGSIDFYSGADAKSFLSDLKQKSTVGGGFTAGMDKLFSFGMNIKFDSDLNSLNTYSDKYSYSRADVVKRVKHLKLNATPAELRNYLQPKFMSDLSSMSADALVARYGTHVLMNITIGGKMQFSYRSRIEDESFTTDKKTAVEAGVKFSIFKFGADYTNSYSGQSIQTQSEKNAAWEFHVDYMGGSGSNTSANFNSETGYPTTSINFGAWENSVNESNAGIISIDWAETFPIWEFIPDPTKRALVREAVERRCLGSKFSMIKVKPLYCRGNESYTWMYTSSQEEWEKWLEITHTHIPIYKYMLGYIFAENEMNTEALNTAESNLTWSDPGYVTYGDDREYLTTDWGWYSMTVINGYTGYDSLTQLGYVGIPKIYPSMVPLYAIYGSSPYIPFITWMVHTDLSKINAFNSKLKSDGYTTNVVKVGYIFPPTE